MNNIKPFLIKRNDTYPNLMLKIKSQGEFNQSVTFNLSGVTATTFSMSDSDGNLKISSATADIISDVNGTLQYSWNNGDTDVSGSFNGEFELFFTGGKKISIPKTGFISIFIADDLNES